MQIWIHNSHLYGTSYSPTWSVILVHGIASIKLNQPRNFSILLKNLMKRFVFHIGVTKSSNSSVTNEIDLFNVYLKPVTIFSKKIKFSTSIVHENLVNFVANAFAARRGESGRCFGEVIDHAGDLAHQRLGGSVLLTVIGPRDVTWLSDVTLAVQFVQLHHDALTDVFLLQRQEWDELTDQMLVHQRTVPPTAFCKRRKTWNSKNRM